MSPTKTVPVSLPPSSLDDKPDVPVEVGLGDRERCHLLLGRLRLRLLLLVLLGHRLEDGHVEPKHREFFDGFSMSPHHPIKLSRHGVGRRGSRVALGTAPEQGVVVQRVFVKRHEADCREALEAGLLVEGRVEASYDEGFRSL